ncbi:DUF805 domain-containing protein [Rickettsiales endosymbiont of Peranema trichophorum]|uniref:DUF805 domain-containing protein n=1 Tax=Rickettsiales endosymbiont of Peranema trichophorum TaxID=2486577 RepID=UPI001A91F5D0
MKNKFYSFATFPFKISTRINRFGFIINTVLNTLLMLLSTLLIVTLCVVMCLSDGCHAQDGLRLFTTQSWLFGILYAATFIRYFTTSIVLHISRLHDIGYSGYWLLLSLIPFVVIIFSLILCLAPGTKGQNIFGEQPAPPSNIAVAFIIGTIALCFLLFLVGSLVFHIKTLSHYIG